MLYTVTYRLQSFLRMQIQLHYFLLHFHIKSNTDIRNYREKESSTPERVKEWSAKEQSHAAWERFVHLSEATCEQQHGGRASHKTCTAWLKALRGDPRSQQYSHLTARVPLACSRLPVWSVAFALFFFFLSPSCPSELDSYFPATCIPQRKGKLIHEVPICIKHRNICHGLPVRGASIRSETLRLVVCP